VRDLNVKQVAALTKPGTYRVRKNLYLQIGPTGTKAWLFRYMRNGRSHGMGLGPLDLVTLAEASDKTLAYRKMLLNGADPLAARRAQRAQTALEAARTLTFKKCAEQYIAAHSKGWRNGKHHAQWESTLETYAYPVIGDLPVSDIDTALIMKIIEPLWIGTTDEQGKPVPPKTETASRLRGRIEAIWDWAKARNYCTGENPARWRGHLDKLLPKRSMVAPVNHHEALPYAQIPTFMAELRDRKGTAARCLEFIVLTAARSEAGRGARWDEIDMDARTWTVPAERMKRMNGNGKSHVVPLSDAVLKLLKSVPRSGELVFEGDRHGRPISETSIRKLLGRMACTKGTGVTQHGFRSTFKDWASERTSHPDIVSEMALAHTIPDKVQAAYRRGDLLQKRRDLMQDWAVYCAG
jgi:integrase